MILEVAGQQYQVEYTDDPHAVGRAIVSWEPPFITFDTETTGLHIKKDRPFMGAVCVQNQVYVFPAEEKILRYLPVWSTYVQRVWGHNITFDMHMVANVTGDDVVMQVKNWADTQALARLTVEAISAREGGDKIGLKELGKKYIDRNADYWENQVKAWLKAREAHNQKVLTAFLKGVGWTKKQLHEALENGDPLPPEVVQVVQEWQKNYPKPTYRDVPLDIMLPYVAVDVILTKLLVEKCMPIIEYRKQEAVLKRELDLLPVVWEMERQGLPVDRAYLLDCKAKMEAYIQKLYDQLYELTGERFSVNERKALQRIYTEVLGEEPKSLDKRFLKKMAENGDKIAPIITRLRRLEKWLATYVERILEVSEYDGRFYTQLNQFGAVSGRFSSDAQQFPKDPIYTEEGYQWEKEHPDHAVPDEFILFHPRRAFVGRMAYLDYSQIELRVQAHYTLPFGGDLNLCRAYMPFKCRHYKTGEEYDYRTPEQRARWSELREDAPKNLHWEEALEKGLSAWLTEDGQPWKPTDVHLATTLRALRIMGHDPEKMDPKLIKWWRKKGKQFNFMRNYGGGDAKAAETLEIAIEQARALNRGYTEAFPLVVTYQNAVIKRAREVGFVRNLYGRRYYLADWTKHYKLANYLIQGSCADMLKMKMLEIYRFLKDNGLKTKMILCVHDELQLALGEGEEWVIFEIKRIMENTPEVMVPVVAETEITYTNWAEKQPIHEWEVKR